MIFIFFVEVIFKGDQINTWKVNINFKKFK